MKICNHTVNIEEFNLNVVCDLSINQDLDPATHPDDIQNTYSVTVEVDRIRTIEVLLFDKVGLDVTNEVRRDKYLTKRLVDAIIEEMSLVNLNDLKAA